MNTKQTKELLLDFLTWIEDKYYDNEGKIDCVNTYLANNNSALGKQKPLAKNKQTNEFCCKKCNEPLTITNRRCGDGCDRCTYATK